jgi:hypothetical protein
MDYAAERAWADGFEEEVTAAAFDVPEKAAARPSR